MTNALSQTDEAADPDVIMVDSASELESEAIDVDTPPRER
jgi:hypothetical protein